MDIQQSMRLVVTGHDENGDSVFVRDEPVSTVMVGPESSLVKLWSTDVPATYPDRGADPGAEGFFPPVGGARLIFGVEGPNQTQFLAAEAYEDGAEGISSNEGWHVSDSTDFIVVLSGEMTLEMDNGESKVIGAGSIIVQNGTRHRWKITGDVPTATVGFILGANRASPSGPSRPHEPQGSRSGGSR